MVNGLPVLGFTPVAIHALSERVDFLISALAIGDSPNAIKVF
jgi:hypothetical protein